MFATSADILNMSLAIGFLVLVVFLCITLFYAILILRDFSSVSNEIKTTVVKIHETIAQPLMAIEFIVDKIRPYIEMFVDKRMNGGKTSAKKK